MLNRMKGSYFSKLVFSHIALTLVLVTVIGGLLLGKTERMMSEEMRQTGEARASSVKRKLEKDLLDSYHSALLNRVLNTVRPEAESEIHYFLENGRGESYSRMARFTQDLKTLTFTLPLLHNISFYFFKDDFVLDQYYHVGPDTSPQAELLRRGTEINPHKWYLRTVPGHNRSIVEQTPVLTYIHTLPFLAKGDRVKGYMIVDLDAAKVIQDASQQLGREDRLLIFAKDGQLIDGSGAVDVGTLTWVRGELAAHRETTLEREQSVITILPAKDSTFNWHYVLIRPQYSALLTTQQMKQEIWIFGTALLLLGLVVSIIASRQVYGTFADIVQRIRSVAGLTKTASPHNVMGSVEQALGIMGQQKRTYLQERKEKQWRALLSGWSKPFEGEVLLPEVQSYIPVYIELSGTDIERLYGKLHEEPESAVDLRGDWVILTARSAYWIMMTRSSRDDLHTAVSEQLEQALLRSSGGDIRFRAGMGTEVTQLEDLSWSALEAQTAARYGFLHRENRLLRYEEVQHRPSVYPDIKPDTFELLLRSGSAAEIEHYLEACESTLLASGTTIEMVELLIMQLGISLSKVYMLQDESEKEHALEPMRFTLFDTMAYLREQSAQLVLNRTEKRNERNERILSGIQSYIQEHIHEDISLEQLTELTSYSKQFICKLFKDELQMTFVDYMTNKRLVNAAALLTSANEPIGHIAERSGFRSSQYFATKFKAKYGVTPVQYRQANGKIMFNLE
ncbi:helix-turn-helix domain-containing protein [Paenibacillus sp. WQ 127069]|uniref:Helix-turn-helix domain-containing protein n=1 Tax=Paenibacillus baimaensis TaxID=2982185 RepID=A0ABT2UGL0_9BACL|nr:helix-turn-helix domain-containing protein [Paenibacillus sp. WQ 127069]MCU6793772.1 helix-turn-helix domain-containing protein [Paenibacillus sp. WQ 127069]